MRTKFSRTGPRSLKGGRKKRMPGTFLTHHLSKKGREEVRLFLPAFPLQSRREKGCRSLLIETAREEGHIGGRERRRASVAAITYTWNGALVHSYLRIFKKSRIEGEKRRKRKSLAGRYRKADLFWLPSIRRERRWGEVLRKGRGGFFEAWEPPPQKER